MMELSIKSETEKRITGPNVGPVSDQIDAQEGKPGVCGGRGRVGSMCPIVRGAKRDVRGAHRMIRFEDRLQRQRGSDHDRRGGIDISGHGFKTAGAVVTGLRAA